MARIQGFGQNVLTLSCVRVMKDFLTVVNSLICSSYYIILPGYLAQRNEEMFYDLSCEINN